jgi:hypothetical protein
MSRYPISCPTLNLSYPVRVVSGHPTLNLSYPVRVVSGHPTQFAPNYATLSTVPGLAPILSPISSVWK